MEKYDKALFDCKVGIKAFQNINASSMGFAKMLDLAKTEDPVLMPSVFYWSVIRYAKPFLNSKFDGGNCSYPTNGLKKADGFSMEMHKHLLTVRNTLVAHDDFTEIPPRLLQFGITNLPEEDFFIPTSIAVSNKCISFPNDPATVHQMQLHAQACCNAVHSKLIEDIGALRQLTLSHPEAAMKDPKYKKSYGEAKIESASTKMQPPEFMNDQWLDTPVPDYSALHNGYMYEDAKIKRDFHGPEKITAPSGLEFMLEP